METFFQQTQRLLGLSFDSNQVNQLKTFEIELIDWNSRFNLTAIRSPEDIRIKHFLDSFTCLQVMGESPPEKLIDVGTGAGFPGIPLKIFFPSMHLTLVESVGKKLGFCQHIVQTLGLSNVEFVQARAEEIGQSPQHREQYDWAVARAVANLPVLAEYLLPLVKIKGHALAQKGESGPAETQAAEKAIFLLGGKLEKIVPVQLPGVDDSRYLISIKKIHPTPKPYPRRTGVPQKTPL